MAETTRVKEDNEVFLIHTVEESPCMLCHDKEQRIGATSPTISTSLLMTLYLALDKFEHSGLHWRSSTREMYGCLCNQGPMVQTQATMIVLGVMKQFASKRTLEACKRSLEGYPGIQNA
ncbi:hypothetical protein Ancab_033607 [Ancistrocladus abbreviatus]